jgi:hypothetical protein
MVDFAWGLAAAGYKVKLPLAAARDAKGAAKSLPEPFSVLASRFIKHQDGVNWSSPDHPHDGVRVPGDELHGGGLRGGDGGAELPSSFSSRNASKNKLSASLRSLTPGYMTRFIWAMAKAGAFPEAASLEPAQLVILSQSAMSGKAFSGKAEPSDGKLVAGSQRLAVQGSSSHGKVSKRQRKMQQDTHQEVPPISPLRTVSTVGSVPDVFAVLLERLARLCYQRISALKPRHLSAVAEAAADMKLPYDGLYMAMAHRAKKMANAGRNGSMKYDIYVGHLKA